MAYTPVRPLANGIPVLQNENIYGSLFLGLGENAVIDMNAATIYEPIIDDRATLSGVVGRREGQFAYDVSKKMIAWWDGTKWVYPNFGSLLSVTEPARLVVNDGTLPASNPTTIDGVTVNANDRVLFANDTNQQHNGIYVFSAGAYTRALDMNEAGEFPGKLVVVKEGTAEHDTLWLCTTDTITTLGTDNIIFTKLNFLNNNNYREGLTKDVLNNVDVDYVANSGLMMNGAGDAAQLDVRLQAVSALDKASGLKVRTDNVTVKINASNQLEAMTGIKIVEYIFHYYGGSQPAFHVLDLDSTLAPSMANFTKIANAEMYHSSGDTRLDPNVKIACDIKINNAIKVVTYSWSALAEGEYRMVVYGY